MKAAKFIGNGIVETFEKAIPEIKENEILIKVAYCGLCGSEKRVIRDGFKCVPGHESSGVVEKCGSKAKQLEKGCPVLIYLSEYCGECEACLENNTSQCTNRRGLIGWSYDGGYEEYVAVPDHMVYPIGDLPLELGVIALDTIGTAFHGLRQANLKEDTSVLLIGCGPIGLGCISILKNYYHVKEIYAADVSEYRCKMAEELGAKMIPINPQDTIGSIEAVTGKKRFQCVVEVCGIDATIAASAHYVKAGGQIIMIGEPEKALYLVRTSEWILKDFALVNSWYFPVREIDDNIAFIQANENEVRKLITHYYPMEEMTEAYRTFFSGKSGKVLIRIGD